MSNVTKAIIGGFVAGAIFSAAAGFSVGGWMTGSKAESLAQDRESSAVATALAPICVTNFNEAGDRSAKLSELKGRNEWQRTVFIEDGGWAKMPGGDKSNRSVARMCADLLIAEK